MDGLRSAVIEPGSELVGLRSAVIEPGIKAVWVTICSNRARLELAGSRSAVIEPGRSWLGYGLH